MACTSGGKSELAAVSDQFPVGLRVLVVDDDVTCLRVLETMLQKCMYRVTICSQATAALNLLREKKGCFDIVLSDVHMPDMDGFRLLELVGLEMDLPVIMISGDGRTDLVMRGIRHGACDYLIKPVRDEELKNIWQHVIRKKRNENKDHDHSGSMEDHDHRKRAIDDAEYASPVNDGADEVLKAQKKRRDSKDEDDTELDNDDSTTSKKPRVVWSVELHQQFVSAVNQLGIDKAVPKRILEMMNVPGLTRENVASHLQFRLYLKRLSGVAQQQGGLPTSYCGPVEQNLKLASLGRFDIQALATSGQLPPQTLAALQAELLSQPSGNLILPAIDQRTILHASLQGSKCIAVDPNAAYGQPLIRCPSNVAKQLSQPLMSNEDVHTAWSAKNLGEAVPPYNFGAVVDTNSNILVSIVQQQQQKQSIMPEPSRPINVQPSCLVVPSQSSPNFQAATSPASANLNCSFRNSALDYNKPLLQSNNSSGVGQSLHVEYKPVCMPSEFGAASYVSSMSSCSRNVQDSACQRVPCSSSTVNAIMHVPNMNCVQGSYNGKPDSVQGSTRNFVYIGKGTSIPSCFAADEQELPMSNISQRKLYADNNGNKVKQEPSMEIMENMKLGTPVQQHLPPGDLMSVFSD
ncbi:hypothetical protein ACS0TY_011370 [Phlomoides rotata]